MRFVLKPFVSGLSLCVQTRCPGGFGFGPSPWRMLRNADKCQLKRVEFDLVLHQDGGNGFADAYATTTVLAHGSSAAPAPPPDGLTALLCDDDAELNEFNAMMEAALDSGRHHQQQAGVPAAGGSLPDGGPGRSHHHDHYHQQPQLQQQYHQQHQQPQHQGRELASADNSNACPLGGSDDDAIEGE